MKISVTKIEIDRIAVDLLALPISKGDLKKEAQKLLAGLELDHKVLKDFKAEAGEVVLLYGGSGKCKASRIALFGIGDAKTLDDWRKGAISIASRAVELKIAKLAVDFSAIERIAGETGESVSTLAETFVTGSFAGLYRFERLKSGKLDKKRAAEKTKELAELVLRAGASVLDAAERGVEAGRIVGSCQKMARDLVNLPGNHLQAEDISKAAEESAKKYGYEVTVFHKKEIESLGMGGLLAVNKGSFFPPTFTILDYKPKGKPKAVVALVGKGVTFDSGGISIKPSENMGEMKSDMAGAASVLGAVEAAARLALPLHIIGLIPATDNMPDGKAQNPGDVITTYSGITVEVGNTDAEGRLILADALAYATEKYKPDVIIDLATLTGACIVALGYSVAGLFSNNDKLADEIYNAGQKAGEKVWRMPLWDLYDEQIKSDVADVSNTGGRGAGSVTAAKFLEKFIDEHKNWAHIDIAGPSFTPKGGGKVNGGTGFGVSLLVELLKKWS
ncbi:leucyl aminopeptidase [Chlorobium ferrooxidans]|uniref:Probable cytosol aminopeptidase n=1 Tax=Chlorobium ferrooxidans DSM 13031 TaxID=377431 RepID=Q0YT17_9CHLB|nr:leucyl aminopeptidase [Chlorobium ferrooxidans]EAT59447.1 Leucyl aminopeptidase [Chlorobium ferrooxidans DSM 13031]